jgi:hypothetical protein
MPGMSPELIRIHPTRILGFGYEDPNPAENDPTTQTPAST